jgi:hypothetical protein
VTRVRWWLAIGVFVAASSALEMLAGQAPHSELLWHRLPGFDFVYGLAGCALIVVVSKWLGKRCLQRPEDYYRDEESRSR